MHTHDRLECEHSTSILLPMMKWQWKKIIFFDIKPFSEKPFNISGMFLSKFNDACDATLYHLLLFTFYIFLFFLGLFFVLFLFIYSVTVTSDILPKQLESTVKKFVNETLAADTFNMNKALEYLHNRSIYNEKGKIDLEKLEGVLRQTMGLQVLLDTEKFGVQVVAFLIRRYQQTKLAFSYMQEHSKETSNNLKQTRCTKKNPDSVGGGEVFRAFTTDGKCVMNEELMGKIQEVAATQSTKDYYTFTANGRKFHNAVEEDLQPYLDAYYKGHKSRFKGTMYKGAKPHMEVYIKLMYYVQRGLIAPFDFNTQKYVNACWGEIGMFI